MEPTSLLHFLRDGSLAVTADGLAATVSQTWVIEGEDRLSYIGILRLVECCREHHWHRDILPLCRAPIDSILVKCEAAFRRPILVGAQVSLKYTVISVGTKSYDLEFNVTLSDAGGDCATVKMRCVFLNPASRQSCQPPSEVANHLRAQIAARASNA